MDCSSLLLELYGRIPPLARRVVDGLSSERLLESPGPDHNPIAWLIWHLARVEDDHLSGLLDEEQIFVSGNWAERFSLTPDPDNTGYGHSPDEVKAVRPDRPEALLEYLDEVDGRARACLEQITEAELEKVVDRSYDPPVTMGVRLVSVASDCLQHLGQAAYVRGLLES